MTAHTFKRLTSIHVVFGSFCKSTPKEILKKYSRILILPWVQFHFILLQPPYDFYIFIKPGDLSLSLSDPSLFFPIFFYQLLPSLNYPSWIVYKIWKSWVILKSNLYRIKICVLVTTSLHLLCLDKLIFKTKVSPQIQIDPGSAYVLECWLCTTQAIPSSAKVPD